MSYLNRYYKVLDYIDTHLEDELTLDSLSDVACLSKYHFHRQFSALFGLTVANYVKLIRIKRASFQLAYRKHIRVIDIALANGYESPEAFSRAFNDLTGQSPTSFRSNPRWDSWHVQYQELKEMRSQRMKSENPKYSVNIVSFDEIKVAALEHQGPPELIGHSVNKFIEWRIKNRLPPSVSRTFNIFYNDPSTIDPEKFRLDICASVKSEVNENSYGIVPKTIPAGRCAVLRHIGSEEDLEESVKYIYSQWLINSDEELRDFPLFFERVKLFPDVPEHEAIIDIYLPLK